MSYQFSEDFLTTFQSILEGCNTTAAANLDAAGSYDPMYQFVFNNISVFTDGTPTGPLSGVDPAVWEWLQFAISINGNDGSAPSDYSRTYTSEEHLLQSGSLVNEADFIHASNALAQSFANQLLVTDSGSLPTLEEIAALDAGTVGNQLFGGNADGWAGTFAFAFLGDTDPFNNWVLDLETVTNPDGGFFKGIAGTYDLISIAEATHSNSIGVLTDIEELINGTGLVANNGLGATATATLLSSLRAAADSFFENAYGLPSNVTEWQVGEALPLYTGFTEAVIGFASAPTFIVGNVSGNNTLEATVGPTGVGGSIVNAGPGSNNSITVFSGNHLIDGGGGLGDSVTYGSALGPVTATWEDVSGTLYQSRFDVVKGSILGVAQGEDYVYGVQTLILPTGEPNTVNMNGSSLFGGTVIGSGSDTVDYTGFTTAGISVSTTTTGLSVTAGGAQSDTLTAVGHLVATSMDDLFTLNRDSTGLTIDGGSGSDTVDMSFGASSLLATTSGITAEGAVTHSVETFIGSSAADVFQGTNGSVDDGLGHHLTYKGNGGGDNYDFNLGIDNGFVELGSASTAIHDNIRIYNTEWVPPNEVDYNLFISETSTSVAGVNYVDLHINGTVAGDDLYIRLNKAQVMAGDFDTLYTTAYLDSGLPFNVRDLVNYLSDHGGEAVPYLSTDMFQFFSTGHNAYYQYGNTSGASTISDSSTGHDHIQFDSSVSSSSASYSQSLTQPLDLLINYGSSGSSVTVTDFFDPATTNHQIQQVDFADGTVQTLSYILQHVFTHTGTAGDDFLTGADYTFAPTDWLYGLAGNDTLNGGLGADTMVGGTGNDTYIVDNVGDVVTENSGEGTDLVQSSISYALPGNVENLTLTGTANINGTGNSVANIITGNSGDNTLDGGLGADTLIGGGGNDTFIVDNAGDVVTAGSGTDTILSSISWDMSSTGHNNTDVEHLTLTGSANINGVGNSLANLITSNTGIDTLAGGAGNDTYILNNSADFVVENSAEGTDTVQASFNIDLTSVANVENVTLTGSGNYSATGNASVNVITGNTGDNTLDGGTGADTLIGGGGNDTFIVDASGDVVTAGSGNDLIQSSISWDMSAAGHNNSNVENLTLTGTSGITGTGNSLDNIITSNTGLDTLAGGSGNDTYFVNNASDMINENSGEGTDTVYTALTWTLGNNIENLTLTGTSAVNGTGNSLDNIIQGNDGVNTLIGNDGNDTLIGGAGNDSLNGGNGNDTLDGGTGVDNMAGGAGDDTYFIDNASDVVSEGTGQGTDTEFSSVSYTSSSLVERLILTGTADINATGNNLTNCTLTGNSGNNVMDDGGGRPGGLDTLIGGAGNDTYHFNNSGDVIIENLNEGTDTVVSTFNMTLGANLENLIIATSSDGNGTGNSLNNSITGNSFNNIIDGAGGTDTLTGRLGNDTYIVDTTTDVIVENAGEGTRDEVQSSVSFDLSSNAMYANIEYLALTGSANLTATGNALDNVITGTTGNCTLDGGTGADTMTGSIGNDVFIVDNVGDTISDSLGTDTVLSSVAHTLEAGLEILTLTGTGNTNGTGNSLVNIITGNSGNNTLDGGTGADTLIGGGGNDTFIVDNTGDSVTGGSGTDTVLSGVSFTLSAALENLTLTGTGNINGIGNSGANVITGNSGNNTLDGGGGADTLTGGTGDDTYVINNSGVTIVESSGAGTDTIQTSMTFDLTSNAMYSNIENLTLTGSSNINGTGNSFDNVITANSGIDTLSGGLGNDTYIVGNASDTIVESTSAGTDLVQSGITFSISSFTNVENLTLTGTSNINGTGNSAVNIITGNSGNNTLDGGGGSDTLIGGAGDDTYVLNNTGITITEGSGAGTDTISTNVTFDLTSNAMYANIENLTLTGTSAIIGTGTSGANVLTGNGISGTSLVGGLGNDTYYLGASDTAVESSSSGGTDTVNEGRASYTLGTNVENLVLTGTSDINGTGNTLANVITGNSGNNTLDGGTGSDTLIGGLGNDVYLVDATTDVVTENTGEGTDTVLASITGYTLAANVENLTLSGTVIAGTGNALDNIITGNTAANTLDGSTGSDTLIGGAGNDVYIVDNVHDVITESASAGTDSVTFTSTTAGDTYTLSSDVENLTLSGTANINGTGNSLVNVITGNSGDNTLDGGTGADSLIGGAGNDTYVVDSTSEVLTEGTSAGTDTVMSSVTWTLATNFENLTLTGSAAINGTGNTANNIMIGNSGANTLSASSGNDTLDGGDGLDTLTGGTGTDIFLFHSATAFHNIDVVTDFTTAQTDKINIADLLTGFHSGTDNIADFVSFVTSGSNTLLKVDMDGTGGTYSMTQIATLNGITGLSAATLLANGELIVS